MAVLTHIAIATRLSLLQATAPSISAAPPVTGFTPNDIVNLAQVVGNLGVILTLLFALWQWRKNIRLSRMVSAQSCAHALNEFYMSLATNTDLAFIYQRGRKDPDLLTDAERARFFYTCVAWFAHHEQAFGHWKAGLLPIEFWESWEKALSEDLQDQGFMHFWNLERSNFDASFRIFLDDKIASINAKGGNHLERDCSRPQTQNSGKT